MFIQEFEKWMEAVADKFKPKSRMGKALVYTYTLLPRRPASRELASLACN